VNASPTFYWHDYETFGADPARDRPCQFAGLRTDASLQEVGEPLVIYCRPPPDYLPQPDACLITGITPQVALERGVPEPEFIARIHSELARPGTCAVGYNSIRFDDEVTRHTLYRNFYDPYAREWRGGNSRWDIIDVLRMARALRPEGIAWPDNADGKPSFRLEDLTRANGIEHAGAHDALSDVRATLAMARLLRAQQPKLFDFALSARDKGWVKRHLNVVERKPVLHVSARFPAENGCTALVVPLAVNPRNANAIICCNLLLDPGPLAELDAAALRELLFTARADLPADAPRVPLKLVHVNRSPMIAPAAMLTRDIAGRLGIDLGRCREHLERVCAIPGLSEKLGEIYRGAGETVNPDPELALYGGGFLGERDRALLDEVRKAEPAALATRRFAFEDERLPELLFRYRARNFPATLDAEEQARWAEHCRERLQGPGFNLVSYHRRIAELGRATEGDDRARAILDALEDYGRSLAAAA